MESSRKRKIPGSKLTAMIEWIVSQGGSEVRTNFFTEVRLTRTEWENTQINIKPVGLVQIQENGNN